MPIQPTVWLVDDDMDDQELLEFVFNNLTPPLRVKKLSDGEDLLACLKDEPEALPKLVLLDLNMPRVNGFEALERLRTYPHCQTLPVVVLTTSNQERDRVKALQLGATAFLTKPASLADTTTMIQALSLAWQLHQ